MTILIPQVIIDIIIEYKESYFFHQKFINCLNDIPLQSIFLKIKYIQTIYNNEHNNDYLDLILTLTSHDERIQMMKFLNTCNCCHRHNKNKPTLEQYMSGYVPMYSTSNIMNNYNCKCFCRTSARALCRAQNDEIIID
jgi:hypothetical protein